MRLRRGTGLLAIAGAALILTGCGDLLSLHSLYTSQDKLFNAAIEGRWETDDDLLTVERAGDMYTATLKSKNDPSQASKFEVRLVDIAGVHFADLLPEDRVGHMFLKVVVSGDRLSVAFLDSEWLRQRVPHQDADIDNGRKQAVLTMPTPELRALVAKYAREPKAYDKGGAYRRAK